MRYYIDIYVHDREEKWKRRLYKQYTSVDFSWLIDILCEYQGEEFDVIVLERAITETG